jgi:hypothetical protein
MYKWRVKGTLAFTDLDLRGTLRLFWFKSRLYTLLHWYLSLELIGNDLLASQKKKKQFRPKHFLELQERTT